VIVIGTVIVDVNLNGNDPVGVLDTLDDQR
jgi:hypothetical protein